MDAIAQRAYQSFNGSFFDDINSYTSGFISLVFNVLLIYSTSKIKTYTKSVRFSMYSMSILRLAFSLSIILTCPAIIYSKSIKSLYIIKNGFNFPTAIGDALLALFVAFIVMSCNGPAVQYLQVANLLSTSSRKEVSKTISIMPIAVVITSLVLIFFGYIPPFYEIHLSSYLLEKLAEQGDTAFLIITVRLTFDPSNQSNDFQVLSQICTLFILIIMFISIIIVVVCYFYIQKQMKIRFSVSSVSKKSQEQLNMALLLQFILPFITIHIPFYIIVILPFFGIAGRILADQVLYLFCWCPAINPILVIAMVKSILYSRNATSLYIIKNGINFSNGFGYVFLSLFVAFMVMSCNGPALQYLQVSYLLSLTHTKDTKRYLTVVPMVVVITSLALIYFGYIPPFYKIRISSLVRKILEEQGDTPFLIITVRLTYDATKTSNTFQFLSQTCTFFILIVMFISILTVITCTVYIQKQMKIRFIPSSTSKKSQEQLNMALLLQFILPFITIHIPFYIIVILPFFGIALRLLADRILFLFCWCPAINPILVILLVKKIRNELFPCQNNKMSQTQTRSIAIVVSM